MRRKLPLIKRVSDWQYSEWPVLHRRSINKNLIMVLGSIVVSIVGEPLTVLFEVLPALILQHRVP